MCLAQNKWGYVLLDFIKITEKEMLENDLYRPITGSLILVKCNDKYLVAFNKWRNQWEIPAGGLEQGETPRECVERELLEETGFNIDISELKFVFQGRYSKEKDIALFLYIGKLFFDVKKAQCNSFFINHYGKKLPEVDNFCFFDMNEAIEKTSKSMKTILMNIKDKKCLIN